MDGTFGALWRDRFATEPPEGASAAPDPATARLLAHRTHRRYADRPVDEAAVAALLAAALSAPSKSDLQQVSILRIADPGLRARIAALIPAMPWIGAAPEFFVFCGDNRRIRRVCALRGLDYANDTMDAVLNAAIDAALAMQAMIAAAEIAGLGACPISHVRDHVERIAEMLEIPDGVFPISGLCIGHPAEEGFVSVRLPPSVTVHTDRYDDGALAEEIEAYDRRRDARYAIPAGKRKHVDLFGDPEFYGWSEDKARQMAVEDGRTMRAFLAARGFALA